MTLAKISLHCILNFEQSKLVARSRKHELVKGEVNKKQCQSGHSFELYAYNNNAIFFEIFSIQNLENSK